MKKYDKPWAAFFGVFIIGIITAAFNSKDFLYWAFERHQNQMSWYIRPLFIIPFCFFAYKKSWAGVIGTICLLLTSMFWFPAPQVIDKDVAHFLQMEKKWLTSTWSIRETFMSLTVPIFFFILGLAFWKRSLWMGLVVIVLAAVGKILWSVSSGQPGKSVIAPALVGLGICLGLIYYGFKRLEKREEADSANP